MSACMSKGVAVSMRAKHERGVGASMRAGAHMNVILLQTRMKISK